MPPSPPPTIARHYGLDWLRIGAFALLILFHIGVYFAPGHWIVKSPQPVAWAAWPLAAIVPWRLTVLFAVSGYATAAMMQRYPAIPAFLAERSRRLLIPLLFGMVVIVPPQDWVRLEVSGVDQGYLDYLLRDNFAFAIHAGTFFPNWEHLWFLPYLWAYTVLVAGVMTLLPRWRTRLEPALAWLTRGRRLLYLPALLILGGMAVLKKLQISFLVESIDYLPAFVFGVAYAHFPALRLTTGRLFREALAISLAMLAIIWWLLATETADPNRIEQLAELASGSLMSWAMLIVMFHLATRFLDFDHRLRQPLAAAVFPAYIVHQTIIVVVGWYLARGGVVGLPAFLTQLAAVLSGCCAAWALARSSSLAGIVLGMPRKPRREPVADARLGPAI